MTRLRPDQSTASPPRAVVVFALGDRRLAVAAEHVVEVIRLTAYTPLPCEDPANLGVGLHRDRCIPLVDLGLRLGLPRAQWVGSGDLCLVVRTGWGELGCPVDAVFGIEPTPNNGAPEGLTVLDLVALGGAHGESVGR